MTCKECGKKLLPYKGKYGRRDRAQKVVFIHKEPTDHFPRYR